MELSDKQFSFAYLKLLESITWKNKKTIAMEFYRNQLQTNNVEDVEIYLKWRIDLPVKVEQKKEDVVEVVHKFNKVNNTYKMEVEWIEVRNETLTPAQKFMEEMKKKADEALNKPIVTIPNNNIVKWVYVPPTDKYWFYEWD